MTFPLYLKKSRLDTWFYGITFLPPETATSIQTAQILATVSREAEKALQGPIIDSFGNNHGLELGAGFVPMIVRWCHPRYNAHYGTG